MKKRPKNIKLKQIVPSDETEYIYEEYYDDEDGDLDDLIFYSLQNEQSDK